MKNKKKKSFSFLLAIGLCFGVFGCKGRAEEKKNFVDFYVNDVRIEEYVVVYDVKDTYAHYCAQNTAALLQNILGCEMRVISDMVKEQEYEILIGDTNRQIGQSLSSLRLEENEYIVSATQNKIILYGNGYMVGGAANHFVNEQIATAKEEHTTEITCNANNTPYTYAYQTPESVILMIGDGMGNNHIQAAKAENAIEEFYPLHMPYQGAVTTFSHSVRIGEATYTDSAAAATALATGYKTHNGVVGLDSEYNKVKNVRELAQERGANTAVITTDKITGATPAAFTAHCDSRDKKEDIQSQIAVLLAMGKLTAIAEDMGDELRETTADILARISAQNARFFAMIEEGYIDKYSHKNDKEDMFVALRRFNDTIAYVMEFVLMHPKTMLIVTADHETGGLTEYGGLYLYTTENHTNANVSVFAMGGAMPDGVIDNTDIARQIAKVFGEENFGDKT